VPDVDRFVDERVGLDPLLGDGVDGVLEDLRSRRAACGKARTSR
jgi:hypothetical protein